MARGNLYMVHRCCFAHKVLTGKGDHCYTDGKELPYIFTSVGPLLEDFIAAVETRRAS